MENKTIQIQVQGGVVIDVVNLPDGVDYEIIDLDSSHADEPDYEDKIAPALEALANYITLRPQHDS